ncbi:hypothetical protein L4D09_11825 [Photobacterium makurazakiensis]|uniref:hypothetical protein n=1 Tax=Photobacterium makurazakiensis TaxID=2910234 RepID=UPI003D0D6ECE
MIVSSPEITEDKNKCIISCNIETKDSKSTLWFSVPIHYKDAILKNRLDAFLVALLPLAMFKGEELYLDGEVSEKLIYSIDSYYIRLLNTIDSSFSPVAIKPANITNKKINSNTYGGATGFSGGVDSFCVISNHINNSKYPSYNISKLLFNNVGALPSHLFNKKFDLLKPVSEQLGVELIPIDSNMDDLLDGVPFILSHNTRNIACALVLQSVYSKYYYASGYSYSDTKVNSTKDIATIDPLSIHLFSTENLDVISSGGQYSRVEKTRIISNYKPSNKLLNVCISANRIDNCSRCWKCGRTLLVLELLGSIKQYSDVFDLKVWEVNRKWYIAEYLLNHKKRNDPLSKEVRDFAIASDYKFTVSDRLLTLFVTCFPSNIVSFVRKLFTH